MRLGLPVHVFGCRDLPAHDARPWYAAPHPSVSLAYLYDILRYLQANALHMYRLHDQVLPRGWLRGGGSLNDLTAQLDALGELAATADVRLSVHAPTHLVLNAPSEDQADEARTFLQAYAGLLDAMSLGSEAVVVLHVGGVYGDRQAALDRFCARFDALPAPVRRRLALEQDDRRFGHVDVLHLYQRCGIPLVLDNLHHHILNPQGIPLRDALQESLTTWPVGVRPKVHFSSPRTEMRRAPGTRQWQPPRWTEHSDLANPFEFLAFLEMAEGLDPFDIMLEARARDLAVLRLRKDLDHWAPQWGARLT